MCRAASISRENCSSTSCIFPKICLSSVARVDPARREQSSSVRSYIACFNSCTSSNAPALFLSRLKHASMKWHNPRSIRVFSLTNDAYAAFHRGASLESNTSSIFVVSIARHIASTRAEISSTPSASSVTALSRGLRNVRKSFATTTISVNSSHTLAA